MRTSRAAPEALSPTAASRSEWRGRARGATVGLRSYRNVAVEALVRRDDLPDVEAGARHARATTARAIRCPRPERGGGGPAAVRPELRRFTIDEYEHLAAASPMSRRAAQVRVLADRWRLYATIINVI